jgi:hypothetical protein
LEDLGAEVRIISAWEMIRENIKVLPKTRLLRIEEAYAMV